MDFRSALVPNTSVDLYAKNLSLSTLAPNAPLYTDANRNIVSGSPSTLISYCQAGGSAFTAIPANSSLSINSFNGAQGPLNSGFTVLSDTGVRFENSGIYQLTYTYNGTAYVDGGMQVTLYINDQPTIFAAYIPANGTLGQGVQEWLSPTLSLVYSFNAGDNITFYGTNFSANAAGIDGVNVCIIKIA
jgi:hypothetical protein